MPGIALCLLAGWAAAADYHAGPDDYRKYLAVLQAGDRLVLEPGDYHRGLPLHGLEGVPGSPIVIEATEGRARARFIARPGANTVSLVNVRYVVLRNLELDGRNIAVDAVKAEGHSRYADFVTLEGLYIHDYSASQQSVGISTKCPAFGWTIRGNRIERVGAGMYLGDADGSDPFVAGVIEDNHVSRTLGYNLQIKHQRQRPEGMAGADARHDTLIRRNYFSKEGEGVAEGVLPRPNVLLGHVPVSGAGMHDRYVVYQNGFDGNPAEALLQAEGHVVVFGNDFVNLRGDAIRVQPHNDVPRTVHVFNNTVLAAQTGISIINKTPPRWEQHVFGNAVFAATPMSGGQQWGNLAARLDEASRYLRRPFGEWQTLDLAPRAVMRYRDIRPWPELPVVPLGRDGRPLVPGEIGAAAASPETKP